MLIAPCGACVEAASRSQEMFNLVQQKLKLITLNVCHQSEHPTKWKTHYDAVVMHEQSQSKNTAHHHLNRRAILPGLDVSISSLMWDSEWQEIMRAHL